MNERPHVKKPLEELYTEWETLVIEAAKPEAERLYTSSRLCRADAPAAEVTLLEERLEACMRDLARLHVARDRVQREIDKHKPERFITQVATLDQIVSQVAEKVSPAPPSPPSADRVAEDIERLRATFLSQEAIAKRAIQRLRFVDAATRMQVLVASGFFVEEPDGRLKPVEPPADEPIKEP